MTQESIKVYTPYKKFKYMDSGTICVKVEAQTEDEQMSFIYDCVPTIQKLEGKFCLVLEINIHHRHNSGIDVADYINLYTELQSVLVREAIKELRNVFGRHQRLILKCNKTITTIEPLETN